MALRKYAFDIVLRHDNHNNLTEYRATVLEKNVQNTPCSATIIATTELSQELVFRENMPNIALCHDNHDSVTR